MEDPNNGSPNRLLPTPPVNDPLPDSGREKEKAFAVESLIATLPSGARYWYVGDFTTEILMY